MPFDDDIFEQLAKQALGVKSPPASTKVAPYRPLSRTTGNKNYDQWYDEEGRNNDIDPNLLFAQGHQESTFKPNALSPAGARGIAQFMPDTAKEFGVNVNDPRSSINGQARLMRKLLDRTGDIDLALAGYNSGHNYDVERLRRNKERIPETRDYVARIRKNYDGTPVDDPFQALARQNLQPIDTGGDPFEDLARTAITRIQPTKELDATIQGQIQSANDPNVKTRFGVLATEPEQATLFANQPNFKPFETKEGTLWLNTAKIYKDKKLKLKNEKDLQQYLKNPKALTTLIGVAEDVGNETRGTAVRAKDPKTGVELATGVVTNPVSAVEQAQNYKDQFPNAEIEVTDTDVVTDERKRMAAQVLDDPRQLGGEFAEVPTELKDREALQPVDTTAIDAMMRAPQRGTVVQPIPQKAVRPVPTKQTAQNAQKPQETTPQTPQGKFVDTDVRFRYDTSKGDLTEQDKNATTSKLTEVTGVDYATVRQFLDNHDWFDTQETESERLAQAKGDVTQVRKIPASVQNQIVEYATRRKANETTLNAAREKVLAENTGLDTNPEMLDILAAKEAGFIGKYEAERKIAKSRDEYIDWLVAKGYARADAVERAFGVKKEDGKPMSAFDWALAKNPLANLITGERKEDTYKAVRKNILDDIEQYGSLANATKAYKAQEEERKLSVLGQPTEALKTAARYITKIPSTIADTVAMATDLDPVTIGYEYVTGNETGVRKGLLDVSEQWRNAVDKDLALMQNPAYKSDFVANELAEGLAQFAVQMVGAPLTGGASLALPLMEGSTAQYREANKAGADRATRITASAVGAILAVPDVLLKAKYLKALTGTGKLKFIENLTGGLFTKLAKKFGEKEAREITKDTVGAFIKKLASNTSLGFGGEYSQERLEDVGNKALAKATYKPELTWEEVILPSAQEKRGYLAAGIAGLFGGTVETTIEKLSNNELKKGDTELAKMLANERISQTNYERAKVALKKEIETRIKRGTYFAKDAQIQAEAAGAEAIDNFINEPTAESPKTVAEPKAEPTAETPVERKVDPKRASVFEETFGEVETPVLKSLGTQDETKTVAEQESIPVEKPKKKIKPTVTTEVTEEPVERTPRLVVKRHYSTITNKGLPIKVNIDKGQYDDIAVTVTDNNGLVLGRSFGNIDNGKLDIKMSDVYEGNQRKGIYTAIVDEFEQIAKENKAQFVKQKEVGRSPASKGFWANRNQLVKPNTIKGDRLRQLWNKSQQANITTEDVTQELAKAKKHLQVLKKTGTGTNAYQNTQRLIQELEFTRDHILPNQVTEEPVKAPVEQPVEKVVDKPTVKDITTERNERLAEIEDEAKSLEAQGEVIKARDLRATTTAVRQEYKKKIAEATKVVDAVSTEKPNVSPKAKNIDIKQPSVDSVNISEGTEIREGDPIYNESGKVGYYREIEHNGKLLKRVQNVKGTPTVGNTIEYKEGNWTKGVPTEEMFKRPVEGSPEFAKATELANLPKRGEKFLEGVKTTAKEGFIDLSPEAVELGRVIDKAVGRSEGIRYGTTYTKAEAIDHIEGAKDLRQVLKDKGMSTKAIDKYIADFEKVAKENQGIVPVGIEASRKHETLHGADLKSRIVNGETITTTKESDAVAKNPTFKKFHDKLNEIAGKKLSTESAMAEAVAYLGDGDYKQFGLTIKEAASVLADIGIARFNSLVEAYDGDVEKAKANMAAFNIEGGEKIYEAIKSTDNGKGVRPSTESGQKREGKSETVGSEDVGNAEEAGQGKASEAKEESDGLKIRQYSESLRDAGFVDSPLVPYIPGTDAQKAEETNRIIETSDPMMHDAEKMFYAKGTDPKLKGVLGTALIDHLGSIGEITRMLKVATDTVEYIGTAAQVLQAAKLVAKYDFASGLMMAQKAANKAGRNLTEKEVENIKVKLEKIAVTTENQATLEYVVEELKTAIKAKDIEIANRDKALAEANTYREATDAELAKLKKQLAHKKTQTTREKLKETHAAREAAIRAQFRDTMMMAVGGEPKFDLKQSLIDEATLDIFDGKTPEQMVRHLQELTNNTLSDAEIADIHLKAWDATGYKTKPTTLDELTAEDKETRLALRERAKARREHIRAINDLKGVQKQSNYEIEVIEYGRANGYTDGEIASALYIPKVKGENAVEQWKKKIEGEFGEVNFHRAWHLRRVANANIKANQLEARHEREQYQGDLKAFENHLSRGRTASAVAKSEFTSYAQKVGRGWVKKTAHAVTETVAATKGLSTWGEISYILRQGFVPLITDTRNAVKGDWQGVGHGLQGDNVMWQKIAGKAGLENIAQYLGDHSVSMFIDRIRQHPSFGDAQRHGIRFTQIGDFNIADDHFSVKALEVIPLYKRTEYAYTLPGDLQRLYMFDAWSKVIDGQGLDVIQTKRAKKYAAETINAFTGKGDVKRILASNGAFAKLLNLTFFSPQLLISRFQTLNRLTTGFATAPKGMKWQMAKKGMRFYGVVGLIALLSGMVLDPDDDDFGTIRIKVGDRDMRDTRVNILAGLDVPAQLYMRTAMGFAKSLVSNDIAYVGDAMKANMTDFVLDKRQTPRFARSKLSPGASFGYDWLDGKDFIGRPTTLWGSVASRVAPLSWQQVYDAFLYDRYKEMVKEPRDLQYGINKAVTHEQKMTNAIVTMVASFLGMGITQYPKDDPSQALQLARQLSPAVSKKDEETLRQEGGLRNLLKAQLTEQGEEREKAKAAVQRWLQKYPALRAEMAKLQSQVKSKTGLLAYYGKDLNADQLRRVREKATDVDEIKLIDSMIKRATKQKR